MENGGQNDIDLTYWTQLQREAEQVERDIRGGNISERLNEREMSLNMALISSYVFLITIQTRTLRNKE